MPDDDPGPDDGDRHASGAEQVLDLAAAAQVGRQAIRVVAQAAQVDDAAQASPGGRLAERGSPSGVLALDVRVLQGVHQVVRGPACSRATHNRRPAKPDPPATSTFTEPPSLPWSGLPCGQAGLSRN